MGGFGRRWRIMGVVHWDWSLGEVLELMKMDLWYSDGHIILELDRYAAREWEVAFSLDNLVIPDRELRGGGLIIMSLQEWYAFYFSSLVYVMLPNRDLR